MPQFGESYGAGWCQCPRKGSISAVSRYGSTQVSFGPGPIGKAVRALLIANGAIWVVTLFSPDLITELFGLTPAAVVTRGYVWQVATYMFLHDPDNISHILFNMLMLWMFGVDLERRWGTRGFVKYYAITGIGAGLCTLLVSLLPIAAVQRMYVLPTVGASGAIFGLLLAWGLLFPTRTILFMFVFPLPARTFVAIMAAIELYTVATRPGGPIAAVAHLGGMLIGWLYLKGPTNLRLELNYRLTKWRMERMRKKFDVHKGGRDQWGNRLH